MDPITAALLLTQAGVGIGKSIYGGIQARKGRAQLAASFQAPTMKPSEYAEMLKQARDSDLTQRRLDEINKSLATSTDALQRGGSRAVLGGVQSLTDAGAKAKLNVLAEQQKDIMTALTQSAQGSEFQRGRDINRETRERTEAQNAITAGTQNIISGLTDVVTAGTTALDSGDLMKKKPKTVKVNPSQLPNAQKDPLKDVVLKIPKTAEELGLEEEELDVAEADAIAATTFKAKGGVQKTPGAFSHSTNPIDIIKDGAKIGEMTGGEYIFNPSQAKQLKKLSKKGSSELHKFVNSLLNKPQFK